jgi:hypothetical protein
LHLPPSGGAPLAEKTMRQIAFLAGLALTALACTATADDKSKGSKVTLDGLTSTTPASWVKVNLPERSMRFLQFRLPVAKGDKNDAEMVIFKLGGDAKSNVRRWQGQFTPPRGKSIDDVSKVSEIKIGGHNATMLDISGTYNAPPFDPTYKGKKMPDFRLIGIQLDGPENTYQIKLLGPAKTVEEYRKGFDEWIKGFRK